jgi:hypothetical protein
MRATTAIPHIRNSSDLLATRLVMKANLARSSLQFTVPPRFAYTRYDPDTAHNPHFHLLAPKLHSECNIPRWARPSYDPGQGRRQAVGQGRTKAVDLGR